MGYQDTSDSIHNKSMGQSSNDDADEVAEMIYLNIALSPSRTTRITLKAGDNPRQMAYDFARVWRITPEKRNILEHTLTLQINKLNQKTKQKFDTAIKEK